MLIWSHLQDTLSSKKKHGVEAGIQYYLFNTNKDIYRQIDYMHTLCMFLPSKKEQNNCSVVPLMKGIEQENLTSFFNFIV